MCFTFVDVVRTRQIFGKLDGHMAVTVDTEICMLGVVIDKQSYHLTISCFTTSWMRPSLALGYGQLDQWRHGLAYFTGVSMYVWWTP